MNQQIINQGLSFLQKQQLPNGSFLSLSSNTDFKNAIKYQTIFSTALILSCLSSLKNSRASGPTDLATKFLLTQKSTNWSFNYWSQESKEHKLLPYPDDLDDTFCALAALYQYNPGLINGEVLAKVVSI